MTALLHALLALAAAAPAHAAVENQAKATLHARAEGRDARVAVRIEIDRGWHLFHGPEGEDIGSAWTVEKLGQPTKIELAGVEAEWGPWRFPEPETEHFDFGEPVEANIHNGSITIWRRGTLAVGATIDGLTAELSGQTCESGPAGTCLPYGEKIERKGPGADALFAGFPVDLSATAPAPSTRSAPRTSDSAAGDDENPGSEASWLAFLLSAVFWGLFTLLMPCTYPMIPITISFFTKQASARHTSTLPLSLAYGFGIVAIFVLIGLIIGPVIIPFATHPVTNLVIGALFLVFALTLFGVMTIQPPAFLMSAAGAARQKGGYLGVFLMGATLVVTSFTCTAPFVGALLGQGAGQGDVGRIAIGMAVFGLTIAVPFVFLSMLPHRVKAMPKAGEWMNTLKVWLGFVEVAAAIKFLSNADLVWGWGWLSRELFLWLWAGTFFAAAAYLLGLIRIKDPYGGGEDGAAVSPKRMTWGLATLLFALYCVYGALGNKLDMVMAALAPNYSGSMGAVTIGAAEPKGHVIIKDDFDAAVARAKSEKKLVLVNFTGFT